MLVKSPQKQKRSEEEDEKKKKIVFGTDMALIHVRLLQQMKVCCGHKKKKPFQHGDIGLYINTKTLTRVQEVDSLIFY
jgi:hypothetical protein